MKKAFVVLGIACLCFSVAVYASDPGTTPHVKQAQHMKGVAASFTINYATHQQTPGQVHGRQTPVYDNTASPSGFFGGDMAVNEEAGDDLVMTTGGKLAELDASIGNNSAVGDIATCDLLFTFREYDNTTVVGSFTTTIDFGSSPLPPGYLATFTITDLGSANIVLPAKVILTTAVTTVTGGADTFELGLYNPTAAGDSADAFWDTAVAGGGPNWYWYSNDPVANLYYGVRVDPVSGDTIIWTDGQERGVYSSGTLTNLGFISGRLVSANRPQRWSAIPFKVPANDTIGKIDVMWFTQAGSEPAVVKYIIWHRSGLTKPVDGQQFSTGTLGNYEPNGVGPTNWYYTYNTNIAIPAGDYYLTVYGDGNPSQTDAWIAWFTGADKQDPALEQAFMWRSEAFPNPGFLAYDAAGAIQPGPGDLDPLCVWNCTYTLWHAGAAPVCPGDMNCDGFVNFADINPFVAILGGQPPCSFANADVNGDGFINFADINPFVALLAAGGGPCP